MADVGALVLTAQITLNPLLEKVPAQAETTNKQRLELTNSPGAAAADRYVAAVFAWADEAQRALQADPDHRYAWQLEVTYDEHVGRAAKMARLGYGGPTALSTFVDTLKEDVPKRLAVGGGVTLLVVALIAIIALRA